MRKQLLKTATLIVLGMSISVQVWAQEHEHSAAPNDVRQEMMQEMRLCMMQMKEESGGMMQMKEENSNMGVHGNNNHAGSDAKADMMEHMMDKMESCMTKEEPDVEPEGSGDHQH